MKKVLLIILAITLLFTACNADATSGLFRTISEAREAISIKYEQILGKDTSGNLYFRTEKGIYSLGKDKSAPDATLIVASKENNIIQSAALVDNNILYTTNKAESTFFIFDTATAGTLDTGYSLLRLIQNGDAILKKNDTSYDYYVGKYDSAKKTITPVSTPFASVPTGFGLDGIFMPSDFKNSTTNTEFVISFVKKDGSSYKSFYVSSSSADEISSTIKNIASVSFVLSHVFVLTTDGKLYHLADPKSHAPTELISTDLKFDRNDFFYPIKDGTNLHFITNPSNTDSMTVFTIADSDAPQNYNTSQTAIKAGYAAALKDTKIVSSLQLDKPERFLVATEKHGMYTVEVKPGKVNKNDSSNFESISSAEGYTF